MGRRNAKKRPWKKKHFLQLCFIALTQSERELSSLLKRARTEAGLAPAGPLGTDKNVFKQYTEHKQKEMDHKSFFFIFCSVKQLASKGELVICKGWECVRWFRRECIRV